MKLNNPNWIWQQPRWPHFEWQDDGILPLLRTVRMKQSVLLGKAGAMSTESAPQGALDTLLQNICY